MHTSSHHLFNPFSPSPSLTSRPASLPTMETPQQRSAIGATAISAGSKPSKQGTVRKLRCRGSKHSPKCIFSPHIEPRPNLVPSLEASPKLPPSPRPLAPLLHGDRPSSHADPVGTRFLPLPWHGRGPAASSSQLTPFLSIVGGSLLLAPNQLGPHRPCFIRGAAGEGTEHVHGSFPPISKPLCVRTVPREVTADICTLDQGTSHGGHGTTAMYSPMICSVSSP